MQLNVQFSVLQQAVSDMGAPLVDFEVKQKISAWSPLDIELHAGKEINIEEIDFTSGLLSYQSTQVLLYIQDQGGRIDDVLINGENGKKFHISDCRTLHEMRAKGRFDRYVVTNRLDGEFYVSGKDWSTGKEGEGYANLKVCKNCLNNLNYKGHQQGGSKGEIFQSFDLKEFFATYSSFFKHHPKYKAGPAAIDGYSKNWKQISDRYKSKQSFVCEQCNVDLSGQKQLLHTHHVNGVKRDNDSSNLRALCADCHRKQNFHDHVFVSHFDMKTINNLRKTQMGLQCSNWKDVFDNSDTALHGLLKMCEQNRMAIPDLEYEIAGVSLELAWPSRKLAIAISPDDIQAANLYGWQVFAVNEALDRCERGAL